MAEKLRCFVIIGYGNKTSYANGKHRVLDLDETYKLLIKPVFDELDIECYRAIDKNVNGSIDELMLREILEADIALADISTLNANVMWELGVRHALKKNYTVMICEQEQMSSIPFDINHFIIHSYVHSEVGIPFKEVERFRNALKTAVGKMLDQDPPVSDSPVFQFVDPHAAFQEDLGITPKGVENQEATFSEILELADKAKDEENYKEALIQYNKAKDLALSNMALSSSVEFITARIALCTYRMNPNSKEVLLEAQKIMEGNNPKSSTDIEVLGISGGIYKRLHDITGDNEHLEESIWFYEKGFQMNQDYFNGINAAHMLFIKARKMKDAGEEFADVKLKADYITSAVLGICKRLKEKPDFDKSESALWILYTMAEAYHYRNQLDLQVEYEALGDDLASKTKDEFAMSSYYEQSKKISELGLNKV